MRTFAEIIDGLGGYAAVAEALGLLPSTVSSMRTRNSIPPEHWPALVDLAALKGFEGIDLHHLASIRRPRKQRGEFRGIVTTQKAPEPPPDFPGVASGLQAAAPTTGKAAA